MKPQLTSLIGLSLLSLVGCATPSPFPETAMRGVAPNVEFGVLTATPDVYRGQVVLLAGRIVGVEQQATGTMLVVHQLPIMPRPPYWPVERNGQNGDFTVLVAGDLHPVDAMVGNRLTIIGTVTDQPPRSGTEAFHPRPYVLATCVAIWATAGEGIADYVVRHGGDGYPPIERTYCWKGTQSAS